MAAAEDGSTGRSTGTAGPWGAERGTGTDFFFFGGTALQIHRDDVRIIEESTMTHIIGIGFSLQDSSDEAVRTLELQLWFYADGTLGSGRLAVPTHLHQMIHPFSWLGETGRS